MPQPHTTQGVSTSGYTIPFFLFGGLLGQAAGAYRGDLHHFHGVFGAVDSRRHGEAAVALQAVSFWTADSPWQVCFVRVSVGQWGPLEE